MNRNVDQVKGEFEGYLQEVRKRFKDRRIAFSHAKYRYELEIPADLVAGQKRPEGFEFTS